MFVSWKTVKDSVSVNKNITWIPFHFGRIYILHIASMHHNYNYNSAYGKKVVFVLSVLALLLREDLGGGVKTMCTKHPDGQLTKDLFAQLI